MEYRTGFKKYRREWIYADEFWGYTGILQEWPVIKKEWMQKAQRFLFQM